MTAWRHVNIDTIDSGQNICPTIYNMVGQQFRLKQLTAEMALFEGKLSHLFLCARRYHLTNCLNSVTSFTKA